MLEKVNVSVIICTRNRAKDISVCLDSVAAAIRNAVGILCELIVVDNGSTDQTKNILEMFESKNPDIRFRVLFEPKAGLSRARNRSFSAAQGDLLVLTDDDCQMHADYILDAVRYDAADTGLVIRGGRIELGNPEDIPLTIKLSPVKTRCSKAARTCRSENLSGYISGCNMVMRRAVFERLGGFDVRLGAGAKIAGSEDTDYLGRAYINGIDIEYVPDMTVYHYHGRRTAEQGKRLLRNYNVGAGAIYLKYLFKEFDLSRPFFWNIKNAVKEIKQSKNLYLPEYNLSYKKLLAYNVYGMMIWAGYIVLDLFGFKASDSSNVR